MDRHHDGGRARHAGDNPLAAEGRALHIFGFRAVRRRSTASLRPGVAEARTAIRSHGRGHLLRHRLAAELLVTLAMVARRA